MPDTNSVNPHHFRSELNLRIERGEICRRSTMSSLRECHRYRVNQYHVLQRVNQSNAMAAWALQEHHDVHGNVITQRPIGYRCVEIPQNRCDWEYVILKETRQWQRHLFGEAHIRIRDALRKRLDESTVEDDWIVRWLSRYPTEEVNINLQILENTSGQGLEAIFLLPFLAYTEQRSLVLTMLKRNAETNEFVVVSSVAVSPGENQITTLHPGMFNGHALLDLFNNPIMIGCLIDEGERYVQLQPVNEEGEEPQDCAICQGEFHTNEPLVALFCEHQFHHNPCLARWYRQCHSQGDNRLNPLVVLCPLCRQSSYYMPCLQPGVTDVYSSSLESLSHHTQHCESCLREYGTPLSQALAHHDSDEQQNHDNVEPLAQAEVVVERYRTELMIRLQPASAPQNGMLRAAQEDNPVLAEQQDNGATAEVVVSDRWHNRIFRRPRFSITHERHHTRDLVYRRGSRVRVEATDTIHRVQSEIRQGGRREPDVMEGSESLTVHQRVTQNFDPNGNPNQ